MTTTPLQKRKRGDVLEVSIDKLAFGAQGVGRCQDLVIFVTGAIPGEKILARLTKRQKNYAEAQKIETLIESPLATQPVCSHFGQCGGCALQNLQYERQCLEKRNQVHDSLFRIGGLSDFFLDETLPASQIYGYRNKMEFSFAREQWLPPEIFDKSNQRESLYLGLHARGFYEKVIDVQHCHLIPPIGSEILSAVRNFAKGSGLPVYSTRSHDGFWRFLVIRHAENTPDLMVNIINARYDERIADQLKTMLTQQFPQITSLLYGVTTSKAGVAFCEHVYPLNGKEFIEEQLGDYRYEISANSFFQTNTRQAERLYQLGLEYAQLTGNEIVYDLYCGAGTIAIFMSRYASRVVGFEAIPAAVTDASRNAARNNVRNSEFVLGDLKNAISKTEEIIAQYGQPDVLIIDPPRGGMHPKTLAAVLALHPERIVYVSCNPTTLARDLKEMCAETYQLIRARPVDMFPHSAHIEVVAQLRRKSS